MSIAPNRSTSPPPRRHLHSRRFPAVLPMKALQTRELSFSRQTRSFSTCLALRRHPARSPSTPNHVVPPLCAAFDCFAQHLATPGALSSTSRPQPSHPLSILPPPIQVRLGQSILYDACAGGDVGVVEQVGGRGLGSVASLDAQHAHRCCIRIFWSMLVKASNEDGGARRLTVDNG